MTIIKKERPPNFDAIAAVFPGAHSTGVLFAYAPYIYAPNHDSLPPEIVAHEQVHIARQEKQGVQNWWALYLVDAEFRLEEEVLAHQAEYRYIAERGSRQVRRNALKTIAKKLASPLYGGVITVAGAMERLEEVESV